MSDFIISTEEKNEIRSLFPHIQNGHIYLNHAAISPLSSNVTAALQAFLRERNRDHVENFKSWMQNTDETRTNLAGFIRAKDPRQITFLGNTSEGISAVAGGFDWKEGDEVILNTLEFPSNIHPFRILEKRGVRLIYVEPDENGIIRTERLEHVITSRTKMLSISAVQYLSGLKADLKSIGSMCKKHKIFLIVDGIQALGATKIDVQEFGIDALASGCHKWMMAPMGIGLLYLSEKLQNVLSPYKTGWLSVEEPWELSNFQQNWLPVSEHLEVGTLNMMGIIGLNASLSVFNRYGPEKLFAEISALGNYAYETLHRQPSVQLVTPGDPNFRAGIVTFSLKGVDNTDKVVQNLNEKKNITISAREGLFRLSPHFYNTKIEIDTVLDELLAR
jgi:cysteine desulfurase / selenocysteine lyase